VPCFASSSSGGCFLLVSGCDNSDNCTALVADLFASAEMLAICSSSVFFPWLLQGVVGWMPHRHFVVVPLWPSFGHLVGFFLFAFPGGWSCFQPFLLGIGWTGWKFNPVEICHAG
jgi:hypothetical protein